MNRVIRFFWMAWAALGVAVLLVGFIQLKGRPVSLLLLTPDQYAQRLSDDGEYVEAANWFTSSLRQGTSLYLGKEFKAAAGRFVGDSSAEGFYNHGNALAMQGLYEKAISSFEQAVALRPDWDDAQYNLQVVTSLAQQNEKKGGNMTDGKMGADEISFSPKKSSEQDDEEEDGFEGSDPMSQEAVWLRQVQTRPVDFLRTKFMYQSVVQEEQSE